MIYHNFYCIFSYYLPGLRYLDGCSYAVCTRNFERRVLLSENSSVVSAQWRPDVSAGILKLMKIRLRGFTFLAVVDRLSLILH
jgi:hypothetical protein